MIRINLSTLLGKKRWTQADLARRTGIRPNTINDLYIFCIKLRRWTKKKVIIYHIGIAVCILCRFSRWAYLASSNVVRSVRRRGNVYSGTNAGLRYFNANNAPSNGAWNYGAGQYPSSGFVQTLMRFLAQSITMQHITFAHPFPRFI